MRRALDLLLALICSVILLPIIALVALVVAAGIGRPVLFTQMRSGRSSIPFRLVKFRTMTNARDARGELLPDAQRMTPVGRLLRRSRLDELPELWNILTGDMSFIGPRPLLPATVEAMGRDGVRRGLVRPGLTGWAQINGNSLLSDADKLALDLWYIDNASGRIDLVIMLKTLLVSLFGERINRQELRRAYAGNSRRSG